VLKNYIPYQSLIFWHMKGLTLIEILIVIAILFTLAALGAGALPLFQRTVDLNASLEDGMSALLRARSKTLAGEDGLQYGVHLSSDRVVLFEGGTYSSSDPKNEETVLPATVEISSITLNGDGAEVIFQKLTGETNQYGTVTFRLTSDFSKTRTLTILETGVVSVE